MNVKEFLLEIDWQELKKCFWERVEWGMMRGTLEKNMETFFNRITEIEPVNAKLVMLFCEGNEPLVKFFEYRDLEALYNPECELLRLKPEKLFGDDLENICRKWSKMISYRADLMPWQLVLGAEIDPENIAGQSAVEIAVMIIQQMTENGYDEPDALLVHKTKANWKNDETGYYIQVMPLKDGSGFVEEPEIFAFRRFLRQKINMYKAIHDYMTRKERRTHDICTF